MTTLLETRDNKIWCLLSPDGLASILSKLKASNLGIIKQSNPVWAATERGMLES